jgi:putative FmdB family regulatory protein
MPTYDYQCDACGHKFEQFQAITASPLKKCHKCGKLKLKRLLGTGVGVIFKGSGFYETDYRSEGYKKAAQSDKPASSTSTESKTEKTETKTESKPALTETKSESKPKPKK